MKRYYLTVLTVAVFVIAAGIGTALAGGSSDTSGEGYHCYGFFTLPDGTFAQFMANASDPVELEEKAVDAVTKYVGDEEGAWKFMICGTADSACVATTDPAQICEEALCDGDVGRMFDQIFAAISDIVFKGKRIHGPLEIVKEQ